MRLLSPITLSAVQAESASAWAQHGDCAMLGDGLTTLQRLAFLLEEVGEVGKAIGEGRTNDEIVSELIQTGYMALAWAEWLDTHPEQASA